MHLGYSKTLETRLVRTMHTVSVRKYLTAGELKTHLGQIPDASILQEPEIDDGGVLILNFVEERIAQSTEQTKESP